MPLRLPSHDGFTLRDRGGCSFLQPLEAELFSTELRSSGHEVEIRPLNDVIHTVWSRIASPAPVGPTNAPLSSRSAGRDPAPSVGVE